MQKSPERATCVSMLGKTLENLMPPLSGLKIRFTPSPQAHAWGYIMSPAISLEAGGVRLVAAQHAYAFRIVVKLWSADASDGVRDLVFVSADWDLLTFVVV